MLQAVNTLSVIERGLDSVYDMLMQLWIKDRLKDLGLKQSDLAHALGVEQPRISEIIKGKRRVRADEAAIIANVLQMPYEDILTLLQPRRDTTLTGVFSSIKKVPVIAWVKAGSLGEMNDGYYKQDAESWVSVEADRDTLIALELKGTSINRRIAPGSIIIVDYSDTDLVPGKLYAIRNEDGDGTVKMYKSNPDRFEPDSTEYHETIFINEELHIIGRVVQSIHRH